MAQQSYNNQALSTVPRTNPRFAVIHPKASARNHQRNILHTVERKMSGLEAVSLTFDSAKVHAHVNMQNIQPQPVSG